jgi:NDP-sugar pyrophosphorylase family protein
MKAMVLAAGLGTRLRPLTDTRPKALVDVGSRTMLEIMLTRLRASGIREVIVNTHHYAEMVEEWLLAHAPTDMRIEVSREGELLDTGGGLKKAAWFFEEPGPDAGEPFLLHNVDVLSTIDFAEMVRAHRESGALATLATQDRPTSRYLLFDENGMLCGRRAGGDGAAELVQAVAGPLALAFAGIHVISPRVFGLLEEEGAFSIIPAYLRLAGRGERIAAFRADRFYWRDLGRPEDVERAAREIIAGRYTV